MKKERGITLIALVITIIVLMILSGVAISLIAGDKSVIQGAQEASSKYGASASKEKSLVENVDNLVKENMNYELVELMSEVDSLKEKVSKLNNVEMKTLYKNDAGATSGTLSESIDNYDYYMIIHGSAISDNTREGNITQSGKATPFSFYSNKWSLYGVFNVIESSFTTEIGRSDYASWNNRYKVYEIVGIKKNKAIDINFDVNIDTSYSDAFNEVQKLEEEIMNINNVEMKTLFKNDAGATSGTLFESANNYDYIIVIHGNANSRVDSSIGLNANGAGFDFSLTGGSVYGTYNMEGDTFSINILLDQGGWGSKYKVYEIIGIKKNKTVEFKSNLDKAEKYSDLKLEIGNLKNYIDSLNDLKLETIYKNDTGATSGTLSENINNYDYIMLIHGNANRNDISRPSVMANLNYTNLAFDFTADVYIYGGFVFEDTTFSRSISGNTESTGGWANRYMAYEVIGIKK